VHLRRVLHDDHVLAFGAADAQLADRRRPVGEQTLLVGDIAPGASDDAGAVHRTDVLLVSAHDRVDDLRRDEPFLGQERLERSDALLGRRRGRVVVVRDGHGAGSR
jgi:uncharacterized protein YbjT (DUF2867 family)